MKKKILFIVPSLGMGGMERVCINYANMLVDRGYNVTIMNFTSHDNNLIKLLSKNVTYLHKYIPVPHLFHLDYKNLLKGNFRILNLNYWTKFHSPKYLYKKYVKEIYDIEIAFYGGTAIKIISASTNKTSKKFGWIHAQTIESHFRLFKNFKEVCLVYNQIQNIICVSDVIKEKLKYLFKRRQNIYVLYNPNNTKNIRKLADENLFEISKTKFTMLTVARIDINTKGFDRIINIVNKLNQEGYNFDFWIIGSGTDEMKLKKLISEKNIKNIELLGQKSNPYKYIKNADLYVCSSRSEGFSMVMAEVLILGKTMIATDISGSREMLGNSEFGLIVNNDEDSLFFGIKKLLEDEAYFNSFKKKATDHKDFLDEDKIIDKLEELFNK